LRKTRDEIASVFAAKADLLEALAAECRADPLAFFVTFSSVSAVVPALAVGVLDYAAANAFMDIFAAQRAAAGDGAYRSIAWPAWTDSSVSAGALEACNRVGFAPLETQHALAALDRALRGGLPPNLLVVPPGSSELDVDGLLRNGRRVSKVPEVSVAPPATGTRPPAWLWQLFSRELGIPVDDLDARASFTDLGVESVMLAELVRKVEQAIRRPLEPSVLIEYCTLERLSARLGELGVPSELDHESTSKTADPSEAPPVADRAEPAPDEAVAVAGSGFGSATQSASLSDAIAVVGLSARFPGAPCADEFWNNLLAGKCSISEVPRERWDTSALYAAAHVLGKSISKWGGFLEGLADFDPEYFDMTQEEAARCDPAIRLFLECAACCLADAGYPAAEVSGSRTGVFVGARLSGYRGRVPLSTGAARLGGDQNFVAARVAHFLDLHGPNLVTDSACSSALVAVKLACQSLLQGESELAFAGAVDILLDEEPYLEFSAARALSPSGRCRSFDRGADGFVPGEGCGVLLLKPLAKALRDGDRVRAVIRAVAVNNDGATMGLTTPNPTAQTDVVRRALEASAVEPAAVGMIEAHGTATMIGDPIELRALTDAFGAACAPGSCAIGSVKSNIGHLMSAAGIAGLIKAILAVERGKIPPTLFCDAPNPRFDFAASPFFPNERVRDWPLDPGARIAGVSAFGLGGTNAHAIVSGLPSALQPAQARVRAPLPAPQFQRKRCWIDRPDEPAASPPAVRAEEIRPRRLEASILELEFVT
jgi:3-oxoacyl-(acyl-carrier-protein) synthase